jgi:xylulose-5-phosphate/fructose-6-phosphate phosphoketolase
MAVDYDSKQYLEGVDTYWRAANYLISWPTILTGQPIVEPGINF